MFTYFVVQSFEAGRKGYLIPDDPIEAKGPAHARLVAERLASHKAAVVAFSRTGDPSTGDFDDAVVIWRHGNVPDTSLEAAG